MEQQAEIARIIAQFKLQPLPVEGGLFVQTYRCAEEYQPGVLPARYPPERRALGTAILFLMTSEPDSFSALHWLPTDEVYHFYLGDPVELALFYPDGTSRQVVLGQDIFHGQQVQFTVPRGVIQGSYLLPGGRYALLGTTMAPGFVESDYHGCDRQVLLQRYPNEGERIRRLTRLDSPLRMEG